LQAHLGQDKFQQAYAAGMALSFGQVLELISGKGSPADLPA